jgi:hypothetical protein
MSLAVSQLRGAVDFELPGPDESEKKKARYDARSNCSSRTTSWAGARH